MNRQDTIGRVTSRTFDVCVIGGGATGAGCALEAQLRGLTTVLVEAADFASGSSSAATKMVHGGVRYLQEAVKGLDIDQYRLVKAALGERELMLRNAPHLTRTVEFLVPCFSRFDQLYYGAGMKIYDLIAGRASLRPSRLLTRSEALSRMPALKADRLIGAVAYADGQFDDARYGMALVTTFLTAGGEALNYARATALEKNSAGKIVAAEVWDEPSQHKFLISAKAFVNATGPTSDVLRQLASSATPPRMHPSKGVHILLPLDGYSKTDAVMVPKTEDGRVIFAIPWNGRLLVGTTDTEYEAGQELVVSVAEVEYLLRQLNPYLARPVQPDDVVSGFAGTRPLVAAQGVSNTAKLIRDDEVEVDSASGLVSILGGKWTTYRLMAQQTIDQVQESLGGGVSASPTPHHLLSGADGYHPGYSQQLTAEHPLLSVGTAEHLAHKYGTLAGSVLQLVSAEPSLGEPLVPGEAPICAQVVYSVRHEMARTIEDVLARRIGLELFGWRLAVKAAPQVGALLGRELNWTASEQSAAVKEYTRRVNHLLVSAGQSPELSGL